MDSAREVAGARTGSPPRRSFQLVSISRDELTGRVDMVAPSEEFAQNELNYWTIHNMRCKAQVRSSIASRSRDIYLSQQHLQRNHREAQLKRRAAEVAEIKRVWPGPDPSASAPGYGTGKSAHSPPNDPIPRLFPVVISTSPFAAMSWSSILVSG